VSKIDERLNLALDRLASDEFLQGRGLGNEIAFYIFDYPADQELLVRERTSKLVDELCHRRPGLRVGHVNLFAMIVEHLKERGLLEKTFELERKKGTAEVMKALAAPLRADRLAQVFVEKTRPEEHDLILVSGIGSVYPLLRSHALLNNLHASMGRTPLVMFFPGVYSGQSLKLFNKLEDENYYRAFKLVP
jgi:Domain of unknown function (DUF1788)